MNFITNTLKQKYNAKLMFTNTDSVVYEIETKDVYEDFYVDKICLILVAIHEIHIFDPVIKKVTGKMKDEFKGKIISKFVGLKWKMYSLVNIDSGENKKAKGVNKNVVKNTQRICWCFV